MYEFQFRYGLSKQELADLKELVKRFHSSRQSSDLSDKIVCWSRAQGTTFATFTPALEPLSPYVMLHLVKSTALRTLDEKRQVFQLFAVPRASFSRGWIFKSYAHGILSSPPDDDQPQLQLVSLVPLSTNQTTYTSTLSSTTTPYSFGDREIRLFHGVEDFKEAPALDDVYYISSALRSPGFDSFIILNGVAHIFQMMVSPEHRVGQTGFALLKKIFPHTVTTWRYILVVPDALANHALTAVDRNPVNAGSLIEYFITTLDLAN